MPDLSSEKQDAGPLLTQSAPRLISKDAPRFFLKRQKGSVLFYIFIAVALLGALTYSFVKDSRQNTTSQMSYRTAEELYVQVNVIRSAIMECALEYTGGGGDLDNDADVDATDNPNNPYPILPMSALNLRAPAGCTTTGSAPGCVSAAANDQARSMTCVGAPLGKTNIFQGANNKGRALPPAPTGLSEWTYFNNASGVYLTIDATTGGGIDALNRLTSKFVNCQAEMSDADTFRVWVQRATCP